MKKFAPGFSVIFMYMLLALAAHAQQTDEYTYSTLRIKITPAILSKMQAAGVYVDEGEHCKDNQFTSVFSAYERKKLEQAGVSFTVIHEDATLEFLQRNVLDMQQHPNPKIEVAATSLNCNFPVPNMFDLGSMGGYLKYEEMLAALDSMHAKYPTLCSEKIPISNTTKTWEGRPLYYVKISDKVATNEVSEPKVLYTGVHHAREAMSLINLIYFMEYILENYNTNADAKRIVNNCELYFVPCVNPDGYIYNETTNPNGGGMWRKNRRKEGVVKNGVDLNRNYGFQWGLNNGSSGNANSDTYRGPAPFSEAESQLIKQLAIDKKFTTSMHHHSYAEILFYPFDYTNTNCVDAVLMKRAGDSLTACNNYSVEHGAGSLGYLASGTTPDWMYGDETEKPKCYSFTNEIGGNSFWPSRSKIIPLCQEQVLLNMRLALFALTQSKKASSITTPAISSSVTLVE